MLWRTLVVFACVAVGVSGDEQKAWEAIYDHWDLGSTWDCRHDACSCPSRYVSCNTAGNITILDLSGSKLSGTIPPEIG